MKTKKEINEEKARLICEAISTPEGRELLEFKMWFPMADFTNPRRKTETEIQWARRVMGIFRDEVANMKK